MSLLYSTEEPLSDDEIYFGKVTLKELKRHILWDKQPKAVLNTASTVNSPKNSDDPDMSLKILQAHSQPNLMSNRENDNSELSPGWDMKAADDSFIKMENMVAKLCMSPRNNEKTEELNNTLEVIEYILNNPPINATTERTETVNEISLKNEIDLMTGVRKEVDMLKLSPQKAENFAYNNTPECLNTPVKTEKQCNDKNTVSHRTTPRDIKPKTIFKTPAQPTSLKKASATSLKKTPSRSNAYQHISSPVASYIKNCPIVPLVKDVHPKKPLPGISSIPKIINNPLLPKLCNKENVNLPAVAYKSAKKTRVIDMPDEQKMPQSQWAKKMTSTLPRPTIMKHNHRELNLAKKKLLSSQEDSFADLSCHQADVSVCTQKTAFKTHKKNF